MKFSDISNIFKNKRVLITGNTGFKGSWLTVWMLRFNAKVYGFSNQILTKPSMFEVTRLSQKIKQVFGDIRDYKKLKKTINSIKPDYIFHLAAQSLVYKSYNDPLYTWQTNTIGTINMLEVLRNYKKKVNVVLITSDKSYKNLEISRGYNENDLLGGKDPYSGSKAAAENAIYSYLNSFNFNNNIRVATARAGNVIGGGDWSDNRLIPDCIKNWSKKKVIKVRSPNATRPWQHVMEALSGYIFLSYFLKKNSKFHGEVFNFGPRQNANYSVKNILNLLKNKLPNFRWNVHSKKKYFESKLLKLNSSKALKFLKWQSVLNINQIINFLTIWYKSYYLKKNIYDLTINQIKEFEKILEKRINK